MQSPSGSSTTFQTELRALFLDKIRERVMALQAALDSDPLFDAPVRQLAHGIRGAGGTYGFPVLSRLAQRVEDAAPEALRAEATVLLDALRRTLRDASVDPRLLIVAARESVQIELRDSLAPESLPDFTAKTWAEALDAIEAGEFRVVICETDPSGTEARQLLEGLGPRATSGELSVVVVTDAVDSQLQADCYRMGAAHVFARPVEPEVLCAAVAAGLQRARACGAAQVVDTLTGLPTRARFQQTMSRLAAMSNRTGAPLSVAVLDLDQFKAINDIHGHPAGDDVLKRFALILREETRDSDYVARWGGEEFVALYYGSSAAQATVALERLRARVKADRFCGPDGTEFRVTFSAGIADLRPESESEIIAAADRLLYQAKASGRDRIVSPQTVVVGATASVLLVEDDELMAAAVTQVLARHGYQVVHLSHPDDVLAAIEDQTFDLGLLDVNLPGMSGFELLERMRRVPTAHRLPVIMLTARSEELDVIRGFKLGADDYVVKPFSPPELAARVNRLARRR